MPTRLSRQPESPQVVGLQWGEFLAWLGDHWEPGQHMDVIAPTGEGKTTFLVQVLDLRRYVCAFDTKGGDETLEKSGWPRSDKWPLPRKMWDQIEKEGECRVILGRKVGRMEDFASLLETQKRALRDIFTQGGWTIYLDELQMLTDPRMGGAAPEVETFLIAARSRRVSVVQGHQRVSRVPRASSEMATWMAVGYTRDRDVVARISEMMGRPRPEIEGAVGALDPHCFLVVNRSPRTPLVVTKPPRL